MLAKHEEAKGWVDSLQLLHEEKIKRSEDATSSLDRVVQTRLAGSETALNAAMAASDKVTQKIELNISSVLMELKAGFAKQIDSINEKIDDLKERMSESSGRAHGTSYNRYDNQKETSLRQDNARNQIALIAVLIAAIGILISLG